MIQTNWCVFTGAPCSGKTSVINRLHMLGYKCIPEAARVYIEQELSKGRTLNQIRADEGAFQNKMISIKKRIESALPVEDNIFLDRAMPDSISYLFLAKMDLSVAIEASNNFRYRHVFVFDPLPWQEDEARNEDDKTIALLDKRLEADYRGLGYEPIRVPVMPIEDRVDLILRQSLQKTVSH